MQDLIEGKTPSTRARWPRGIVGYLSYFTDHVIYGFKRPVDWLGAQLYDASGYGHDTWGKPSLQLLTEAEKRVFIDIALGMTHIGLAEKLQIQKLVALQIVELLQEKTGTHSIAEMTVLARDSNLI